ncbi:MAG: C-GCAxxG-C-C family protein [Dehalococcoidales bacterium]
MDKAKEAYETMLNRKMNCSQSVISVFYQDYGLDKKLALQLAQGFGGGMGHSGQTCGAVTGAYMALGLAQKITTENARENIEKTYALIEKFNREFKALHGSLNCTELTGYDLSSAEKLIEARDKQVFTTICPNLVSDAVKIAESLLK